MNLNDEIAKVAYEIYEKSGYIKGRDFVNWLEAERIVLERHVGQAAEDWKKTTVDEERFAETSEKIKQTRKTVPAKKVTFKEEKKSPKKEKAVKKVTRKKEQ